MNKSCKIVTIHVKLFQNVDVKTIVKYFSREGKKILATALVLSYNFIPFIYTTIMLGAS